MIAALLGEAAPWRIVPGADIASYPFRPIHAAGDHDPILVDDCDDAACRQAFDSKCLLEMLDPCADRKHGTQSAGLVFDWASDGDDQLSSQAATDHVADRETLPGQDLLKICAVEVRSVRPKLVLPECPILVPSSKNMLI